MEKENLENDTFLITLKTNDIDLGHLVQVTSKTY